MDKVDPNTKMRFVAGVVGMSALYFGGVASFGLSVAVSLLGSVSHYAFQERTKRISLEGKKNLKTEPESSSIVQELEQRVETLRAQSSELSSENASIRARLDDAVAGERKAQISLEEIRKDRAGLEEALKEALKEKETVVKQVGTEAYHGLEQKIGELEGVLKEKETLENRVEELTKELDVALKEKEITTKELKSSTVPLVEYEGLEKKVKDLEGELKEKETLENRVDELTKELDVALKEKETTTKELKSSTVPLVKYESAIAALEAQLEEKRKEFSESLEKEKEKLRNMQNENKVLEDEMTKMLESLHLRSQASASEKELRDKLFLLEQEYQESVTTYGDEIQNLKTKVATLERRLKRRSSSRSRSTSAGKNAIPVISGIPELPEHVEHVGLGKQVSASAPVSPLKKDRKAPQEQVVHVAKEVLSTEEQFMIILQSLVFKIYQPLVNSLATKKPILPGSDILTIFGEIRLLYALSFDFYESLKVRVLNWKETSTLGDLFLASETYFSSFGPYVCRYDRARDLVRDLKKSQKSFSSFLARPEVVTLLKGSGLSNLLITPVQRLPRYKILLRELVKNVDASHADYKSLTMAVKKVDDITSQIDKSSETDFTTLHGVSKSIEELSKRIMKFPPGIHLAVPGRRLAWMGSCTEPSVNAGDSNKTETKHFVLFTDLLLETTCMPGTSPALYVYNRMYQLRDVDLARGNQENEIRFMHKKEDGTTSRLLYMESHLERDRLVRLCANLSLTCPSAEVQQIMVLSVEQGIIGGLKKGSSRRQQKKTLKKVQSQSGEPVAKGTLLGLGLSGGSSSNLLSNM